MRTLFIAVSKVFGLVLVYSGLAYITTVLPIVYMLLQGYASSGSGVSVQTTLGSNLPLTTASFVATVAVAFGAAWLLIFRGEWLAGKLGIPEQSGQPPLGGETILGVGIRILALFFIVQATPELVGALLRAVPFGQRRIAEGWSVVLPPALKLALAFLLAFKSQVVIEWMDRSHDRLPREI